MTDELIFANDNELKELRDFDFKIIVPSEKWIPENSPYVYEVNPELDQNVSDDNAVVLEKTDNKISGLDYGVAAASGLLTGALSILWTKEFSLSNAKEIGDQEAKKIIVNIAKSQGFTPKDGAGDDEILKSAITFMENKFPSIGDKLTSEFGGGLQHHLRDFSHHPTIVGLVCSILLQFTGKGIGTDTEGNFIVLKIPEDARPEEKFVRRVINGTITWAFHLISDMAGSRSYPGQGTGIPGVILSLLKEASALPFFHNISVNHNDKQISFSQWISKLFNGTLIRDSEGNPLRFDLRAEMGFAKMLADQARPVLINECIVRGFYFISRFIKELKEKNVKTIADLSRMDASKFLPYKNRALTRMLTVSSGVFVIVNVSGAAVTSVVQSGGDVYAALPHFFLRINYVGVVRFAVACAADAKYIGEEVREMVERYMAQKNDYLTGKSFEPDFRFIKFTEQQTRYLYSLEWNMVQHDMTDTELDKAAIKAEWLERWKDKVLQSIENAKPDYFIDNDNVLFSRIEYESLKEDKPFWLYAVALELIKFTPYYPLDESQKYKDLSFTYDYIRDVFCKKQSVITMDDINKLKELYLGYERWIRADYAKILIGIGASLLSVFIPFGFSFATLIGAGLGAGISLIIASLGEVSHIYTLKECCKLVTLCDYVILGEKASYQSFSYVCAIFWEVKHQADILDEEIKQSKNRKEDPAKIKAMESSKDYLGNCAIQLNNLMRRKGFSGNTFYVPALTAGES